MGVIDDMRALVLRADPDAMRYDHPSGDGPYTVWAEVSRLSISSDDVSDGGWRFAIDRYTRDADDAIAAAIVAELDAAPWAAYDYIVDYDAQTGWIHHAYTCEGV